MDQYLTDLEAMADVQARACAQLVAAGRPDQARRHADRYVEIAQQIERHIRQVAS